MFDWQTIAAALIILAACVYVARRAWARLRSMRAPGEMNSDPSCATGCGKCGDAGAVEATPRKVLVQIGRAKQGRRRAS